MQAASLFAQFSVNNVSQWSCITLAVTAYATTSVFSITEALVQSVQAGAVSQDKRLRKRPHVGAGRVRLLYSLH